MNEIVNWIINLSNGVLASIIAAVFMAIITGGLYILKIKRKSKLKINNSEIGGDVIVGNKGFKQNRRNTSLKESVKSSAKIKNTKIKGDFIQGDKER